MKRLKPFRAKSVKGLSRRPTPQARRAQARKSGNISKTSRRAPFSFLTTSSASISGHHNILDVQRALYRIEIYINLAKAACPAHMLLRFLRHYPQPEIGEINRVHRYLTQQIGLLQKKTYKALLSPDDPVLQRWLARRQGMSSLTRGDFDRCS